MNFISEYLLYTNEYESPTSFWKWSAYSCIGSVLRDNVYLLRGDIKTFPNIYTLLVADSAVHRKGNPVKLCEHFVTSINNTKIISGRSSIQAILDELAKSETDKKTGVTLGGGSAIFIAEELSAGIVNDPEAIKILTDIYTWREVYTSKLRHSPHFKIRNVCFSMMAASNEHLLRDVYDAGAVFGGLLGRTFLIKPNEFRKGNSLFSVDAFKEERKIKYEYLRGQLLQMSMLQGEFVFNPAAQKEYDEWYIPFRESYRSKIDKSGVSGRVHDSIIKLALILCINYTLNLEVKKEHVEEAIAECLQLMPNYQQFIMAGGRSTVANVGSIIMSELYESEGFGKSRKKLLQSNWINFDNNLLDNTIATLTQAGLIKDCQFEDNEIGYVLTERAHELLFKHK